MKKQVFALLAGLFLISASYAAAEIALEPFEYRENFETRELRAWTSYPFWQDTAYNTDMRVNTMVPGDPNISVEHRVTPFAKADSYNGVQKTLDLYLVPGSTVNLRYYLKSDLPCDYLKIRFAAGELGKLDYTIPSPPLNGWKEARLTFEDLAAQNPVARRKETAADLRHRPAHQNHQCGLRENALPGSRRCLGQGHAEDPFPVRRTENAQARRMESLYSGAALPCRGDVHSQGRLAARRGQGHPRYRQLHPAGKESPFLDP